MSAVIMQLDSVRLSYAVGLALELKPLMKK